MTPKTTSLPLSQTLKSLGVKQESYFQWRIDYVGKIETVSLVSNENYETKGDDGNGQVAGSYLIAAFTSDELGEMLPVDLEDDATLEKYKGALFLNITKPYEIGTDGEYIDEEADLMFGKWITSYSNGNGSILRGGDTMVESMGKMLAHLLSSGIIKVTK